jgi:hypothetical protein
LTVPLNGTDRNITLKLEVYWNRIANYWQMNISDASEAYILTGIPLLFSQGKYLDLLAQYQHKGIGSFYVFPTSDNTPDQPLVDSWDKDFVLAWNG